MYSTLSDFALNFEHFSFQSQRDNTLELQSVQPHLAFNRVVVSNSIKSLNNKAEEEEKNSCRSISLSHIAWCFFLLRCCFVLVFVVYKISRFSHKNARPEPERQAKNTEKEGTYWRNRRKRWRNEEEFSRTSRYYVLVNKRSFWWKFSSFSGVESCDCCYRHRRDEMESWRTRETRETHNGAKDGRAKILCNLNFWYRCYF